MRRDCVCSRHCINIPDDDDEELRDDSDNDSSTGESEYNGNDDIDIEEDQEYDKNQQTILLWSSKHTPTIISEMFGGVLL